MAARRQPCAPPQGHQPGLRFFVAAKKGRLFMWMPALPGRPLEASIGASMPVNRGSVDTENYFNIQYLRDCRDQCWTARGMTDSVDAAMRLEASARIAQVVVNLVFGREMPLQVFQGSAVESSQNPLRAPTSGMCRPVVLLDELPRDATGLEQFVDGA